MPLVQTRRTPSTTLHASLHHHTTNTPARGNNTSHLYEWHERQKGCHRSEASSFAVGGAPCPKTGDHSSSRKRDRARPSPSSFPSAYSPLLLLPRPPDLLCSDVVSFGRFPRCFPHL